MYKKLLIKHIILDSTILAVSNDDEVILLLKSCFESFDCILSSENIVEFKYCIEIIKSEDCFNVKCSDFTKGVTDLREVLGLTIRYCIDNLTRENDDSIFLHGASTCYKNYGVAFLGNTGMGKSSISYMLHKNNDISYLSDDVIGLDMKTLKMFSFPKPIFLRELSHLDVYDEVKTNIIKFGLDTRHYKICEKHVSTSELIKLRRIFIIERDEKIGFKYNLLNKTDSFIHIWKNMLYKDNVLEKRGIALKIAEKVPTYKLSYASLSSDINKIKSMIL